MERGRNDSPVDSLPSRSAFSVIELAVLVAMLSLLAAFALPHFASLKIEARVAAAHSLSAQLRSAAALAHKYWLAEGQPEAVSIEGVTIAIVNGYPTAASIDKALPSRAGFSFAADAGIFTRDDAGSPCQVDYDEAAARGALPDIRLDTSGC